MPYIELGGTRIETNEYGFVVDPCSWSKDLAEHMARRDGLALTDGHWEVITFLREYFARYEIAPMIKILIKEIGKRGPERGNTFYIYRLFPDGPAMQACRYAGLPTPAGCV
ncbi:MAG: TusE/DsrC/DsvC family sulfur relay protein [Chloroflexota bacterium]|jgi:dissimilatory sulfite reductase related protein